MFKANPKGVFYSDQRISVARADPKKCRNGDDEDDDQNYLRICQKKIMSIHTGKYFCNPKCSTIVSNCNISSVYKYNIYIIPFLCSIQIRMLDMSTNTQTAMSTSTNTN